jgi:hypothetical protein
MVIDEQAIAFKRGELRVFWATDNSDEAEENTEKQEVSRTAFCRLS